MNEIFQDSFHDQLVAGVRAFVHQSAEFFERHARALLEPRLHREVGVLFELRLDVEDDRQFLIASLEPPPRIRVNTKNWKDYHVVQSTCTGKIDVDKYSMQTINS